MKQLFKEFLNVEIENAPAWQFAVGMIIAYVIGILTGIVVMI